MSNHHHPASLGKAIAEAARRDARYDAMSGRRNSYPGWDMNDDYDRQTYQSAYNNEYARVAKEVHEEKEKRRKEREEERERRARMTPEERAEEEKYGAIGCIIGGIVAYYLIKGLTNFLLGL